MSENEKIENGDTFTVSKKANKKSKTSSTGFGKTVVVPFVSGIVGASLVVGTCFGVPSIKSNLLKGTTANTSYTSASVSDSKSAIDLTQYSETATYVANKVLPSVVGIKITYKINSFFGSSEASATGSGIIISDDGYILTNNHVVTAESTSSFYAITQAANITVKLFNDDTEYPATIVGTDAYTDIAVIKIDAENLTKATLGNSDELQVGEFVLAIGNPLGMDYSVTSGIVSALNREVQIDGSLYNAIQTDAAINSGNSGGALVNAKGEVIGVNSMKLAGSGIEGIGFAIPISSTSNIVDQLITYKTVKRPYIGITGSSVTEQISKRYNLPEGIYIEEVAKDSPAEKAGLKQTDIITKIEGTNVKSVNELNKVKYTHNIGDKVKLTIYREGQEQEFEIDLAEKPEKENQQEQENQTQDPNQSIGSIFNYFFNN